MNSYNVPQHYFTYSYLLRCKSQLSRYHLRSLLSHVGIEDITDELLMLQKVAHYIDGYYPMSLSAFDDSVTVFGILFLIMDNIKNTGGHSKSQFTFPEFIRYHNLPEASKLDINPNKFAQWIIPNVDKIHINLNMVINEINRFGYGSYHVNYLQRFLELKEDDLKSISSEVVTKWPVHIERYMESKLTPKVINSLTAYFNNIMIGNSTDLPTIPGMTEPVQYIVDSGDTKSNYGLPRLVYTFGPIIATTMPYGLLGPYLTITSISGLSKNKYNSFFTLGKQTAISKYARSLAYYMSIFTEFKAIMTLECDECYKYKISDIPNKMINFPDLYRLILQDEQIDEKRVLQKLNKVKVPHDLSDGQRVVLYNYFNNHKDIFAQIKAPVNPKCPFAIEDYIDNIINKIPPNLLRNGIQKTVPNPYLLISEDLYGLYRDDLDIVDAIVLNNYDEALPAQSERILSFVAHIEKSLDMTVHELAYILACLGMRTPNNISEITWAVSIALINILQAGGLKEDIKEANPLPQFFIDDIFSYLADFKIKELAVFLNIKYSNLLTIHQIKDILKRGYISPLPIEPNILARLEKWSTYSPDQIFMTRELYGLVEGREQETFASLGKHIHAGMEFCIDNFDEKHADFIINRLGMVVKSNSSTMADKLIYIKHSVPYLSNLFSTKGSLFPSNMTDLQILQRCDAHLGHQSRRDLIRLFTKFTEEKEPMFFIPNKRNSINKVTFDSVDTEGEDALFTSDLSVPMIAYGTRQRYHLYKITDFYGGFSAKDERKTIYSYRILNPSNLTTYIEITEENADKLFILCKLIGETNKTSENICIELRDLFNRMDIINEHYKRTNEYDRGLINEFSQFSNTEQELLKQAFTDIFYIGMYFRRWKGPGYKFPLKSADTHQDENFDSDTSTVKARCDLLATLQKIERYPNALYFLHYIHIVEHGKGVIAQSSSTTFIDIWNRIIGVNVYAEEEKLALEENRPPNLSNLTGAYCIRMASSYMIGTGHFYINLLYNERIGEDGGYNPFEVEVIQ